MHREVLAIVKRLPDSPELLSVRSTLAGLSVWMGQHAEGATMLREVLAIEQRVLGPQHPDTLSTLRNIAAAEDRLQQQA